MLENKPLSHMIACYGTFSTIVIFGGKFIVFGKDFRQVLPVINRVTPYVSTKSSLLSPYLVTS